MRDVRVNYIPPHFPDQPIVDCIMLNHGQTENPYRMKDIYGIQTGTRIYKLQKKDLEAKPISSYLYFGKYKFSVKYECQEHTCAYCVEIDHTEKECPKKRDFKTFRIENLRKIQNEQLNDETRTEPATQKIIQHPSNNLNNNKKADQLKQSAQKSSKQQSSVTN